MTDNPFLCSYRKNNRAPVSIFIDLRKEMFFSEQIARRILEMRVKSYSNDPKMLSQVNKIKDTLPAFAPSTTSSKRGDENAVKYHTGLIVVDIDMVKHMPEKSIAITSEAVREIVYDNDFCAFAGISPSGNGVKAAFVLDPKPETVEDHRDAYLRVVHDVEQKLWQGIRVLVGDTHTDKDIMDIVWVDRQCVNPERLCYQSYDEDAQIREEYKRVKWRHLPKPPIPVAGQRTTENYQDHMPQGEEDNQAIFDGLMAQTEKDVLDKKWGINYTVEDIKENRVALTIPKPGEAPPEGSMRQVHLCPKDIIKQGNRRTVINNLIFHCYVNLLWPLDFCRDEAYDIVEKYMEQPFGDDFTKADVDKIIITIKREGVPYREETIDRIKAREDHEKRRIYNVEEEEENKNELKKLIKDNKKHFGITQEMLQELTDLGNAMRYLHSEGIYINWSPGSSVGAHHTVVWNFYDSAKKIWVVDTSLVAGQIDTHIFKTLIKMKENCGKTAARTWRALKKECDSHKIEVRWTGKDVSFEGKAFSKLPTKTQLALAKKGDFFIDRKTMVGHIEKFKRKCDSGYARGRYALSHLDTGAHSPLRFTGKWDAKTGVGNSQEGVIDFATGKIKDEPENIFHYHTKKYSHKVLHHLLEQPDEKIAPKYMKFLKRVQPNIEIRKFLLACTGYALTGRADQRFFLIHTGEGQNGKSVNLEVCRNIFGQGRTGYALNIAWTTLSPVTQAESPTPQRAALAGARLVTVSEWDEERARLDGAFLKSFTGNDDNITVRTLNALPFEFKPQALLQIVTNHRPKVTDMSGGMWSRLKLVHWPVIIPKAEQNPELAKSLVAEEGDQIFTLFVKYAIKYMASGRVEIPKQVDFATHEYHTEEDIMAAFFENHLVTAPNRVVTTSALHGAFKERMGSNMYLITFSKKFKSYINRFNATLEEGQEHLEIQFVSGRGKSKPARYVGLRLVDPNLVDKDMDIDTELGNIGLNRPKPHPLAVPATTKQVHN